MHHLAALELGTMSEWVSAFFTLLALVTALVFSIRAERAATEASLTSVHVWTEAVSQGGGLQKRWILVVQNGTEYPIYRWRVIVEWINPTTGSSASSGTDQDSKGILLPGRNEFHFTPDDPLPPSEASIRVTIDFADARGKLRRRQAGGKIVNINHLREERKA